MPRRNVDRERWEAYFMMILLATRPFLFIGAVIILVYAIAAVVAYPVVSGLAIGLAMLLFAMVFFDQAALFVARIGAHLVTLGKNN